MVESSGFRFHRLRGSQGTVPRRVVLLVIPSMSPGPYRDRLERRKAVVIDLIA